MKPLYRFSAIALLVVSSIGCDQATKRLAMSSLKFRAPISYWGDTFRLQYTENNAAFLSFGSSFPEPLRFWVFTVFVAAFLLALGMFMLLKRGLTKLEIAAYSLILGGGIGNLIDRVMRNGLVVDFMNIGVGSLRTGIFNVADMSIMLGIFLLLGTRFFEENPLKVAEPNISG